MIDCHCHFDMFPNPEEIVTESELNKIITIGMTNLPSHFEMGYQRLVGYKYVRLALGLHPLLAEQHEKELPQFLRLLEKTSFIGEIGLDFSKEGINTKIEQIKTLEIILNRIKKENKILSLHSRKAEDKVLESLKKYDIKNAIFHWYSGPLSILKDILNCNYYFSINPSMTQSNSGQKIIYSIPLTQVLTETDAPFSKFKGRLTRPRDVRYVIDYLAKVHSISNKEVEKIVRTNFYSLVEKCKKV